MERGLGPPCDHDKRMFIFAIGGEAFLVPRHPVCTYSNVSRAIYQSNLSNLFYMYASASMQAK